MVRLSLPDRMSHFLVINACVCVCVCVLRFYAETEPVGYIHNTHIHTCVYMYCARVCPVGCVSLGNPD